MTHASSDVTECLEGGEDAVDLIDALFVLPPEAGVEGFRVTYNLTGEDPAALWRNYINLVRIEVWHPPSAPITYGGAIGAVTHTMLGGAPRSGPQKPRGAGNRCAQHATNPAGFHLRDRVRNRHANYQSLMFAGSCWREVFNEHSM